MVTKMQMLGPGMYTQSTVPCEHCNGTGEIIDPDDVCPECNGKKVIKERKVLEVNIDKGIESLTYSATTGYFYAGIQHTATVHVLDVDVDVPVLCGHLQSGGAAELDGFRMMINCFAGLD